MVLFPVCLSTVLPKTSPVNKDFFNHLYNIAYRHAFTEKLQSTSRTNPRAFPAVGAQLPVDLDLAILSRRQVYRFNRADRDAPFAAIAL
jgi:hypothetical protein